MIAKIYIEGGGDRKSSHSKDRKICFRTGWRRFFAAAGLGGRMPRVVRGGGRDETIDKFHTALKNPEKDILPLLLVDSEGGVQAGHSAWEHLETQKSETRSKPWRRPPGAVDDQAFLMVQVMETWFLADRDGLKSFFDQAFVENAIRPWPDLESVRKDDVLDTLRRATAKCRVPYSKGNTSFDLLGHICPSQVEEACPHAKEILDRLRAL